MKRLLIIILIFVGCRTEPMKKPFVIISISMYNRYDSVHYIDADGQEGYFEADHNIYHVGDTIY